MGVACRPRGSLGLRAGRGERLGEPHPASANEARCCLFRPLSARGEGEGGEVPVPGADVERLLGPVQMPGFSRSACGVQAKACATRRASR